MDTRTRILDTALACFIESGYEQTTIARIRERSGVSNGALFHHFATKEAIADALYVAAMASFQDGLWELLRRRPRSLRAAVSGTISHQLHWIEENEDRARFLYMRGHLDWDSPAGAQLQGLNRNLAEAYRDRMAPLVGGRRNPSDVDADADRHRHRPGSRDRATLALWAARLTAPWLSERARRRRLRRAQRGPREPPAPTTLARASRPDPTRARVGRRQGDRRRSGHRRAPPAAGRLMFRLVSNRFCLGR